MSVEIPEGYGIVIRIVPMTQPRGQVALRVERDGRTIHDEILQPSQLPGALMHVLGAIVGDLTDAIRAPAHQKLMSILFANDTE